MGTILWLLFQKCFFTIIAWTKDTSACLPLGHLPVVMSSRFTVLKLLSLFSMFPPASETCNDFHPMFFTHDRSFEEFFCICIQLLNKTWKEMRATSEDFNKVMWISVRGRGFLWHQRGLLHGPLSVQKAFGKVGKWGRLQWQLLQEWRKTNIPV